MRFNLDLTFQILYCDNNQKKIKDVKVFVAKIQTVWYYDCEE